ncbi:MAG TPA: chemotaxis protein CheA [Firmicutes bacterium]|jgi:two-component system chemotaxis sensor kinase CheA|nr:chemotaxis protein CheA [Bacillota bacterium]HBK68344.1 chemotaxis protein CheA [Bacillota bacterium]HBT16066.1 chemotaxis protein CheA [Bacillota bacterium]
MEVSQYLNVFMDECYEHLQSLNQSLLVLEKEPDNIEVLNSIFRAAHTLKGASATMGFNKMSSVTHAMEDVLSLLRQNELKVSPEIINILFDALDLLEVLAKGIAEGQEEDVEVAGVLQGLKKYSAKEVKREPTVKDERRKTLQLRYSPEEKEQINKALAEGFTLYHLHLFLEEECLLKGARSFMVLRELESQGEIVRTIPTAKELEDEKFDSDFIIGLLSKKPLEILTRYLEKMLDVKEVKGEVHDSNDLLIERRGGELSSTPVVSEPQKANTAKVHSNVSPTVRVDIRKLDDLMNLVGELVITRSRLEQLSSEKEDQSLQEAVEQLSHLTLDLRDQVLKTRMVPVEQIFSRFPRLVRDLSKETGKEVELQISGADTELDRTVIDEIVDPLVHIIRNSVDHGIEEPQVREASGKATQGVIALNAYQTGNNVVISVSDDGQGIDPEKVKARALAKEFITPELLENMEEEEIINLIFLPGFSTSEQVTDVSGRGVGMDIVKTKITDLGGMLQVSSVKGKGTTMTIRLPLTLAIIQTLIIHLGADVFAIPTSLIEQTISVARKDIKWLRNQEVTFLRGEVVPLVRLQDYLGVSEAKNPNLDELDVVVIRNGDRRLGCVVDTLVRQQDVVIKSLGAYLGNIPGIAGATILGNGKIALILDLRSVA